MEVTKANFQELFPEIEETIKQSEFLSVDGEFTGLNYGNNITAYDTPEQYYAKLLSGALDFLFIQFGLAAFQKVPESSSYKCKVYNFYVFPKPLNRSAPDCRFVCQSSSLDFLASNGFDFNKLFTNGIPYLTQSDEESLNEKMAERRRQLAVNNASSTPIPIPQQFKQQVDDACKKIEELLSPDYSNEEIRIEKCSGFVRKLIYQTVRERFPADKVHVETKQGVLVAQKRSKPPSSPEDEEREALEKEKKEVDEAVGFSKVIRAISASEKLVVGHNMLLDLCHMIHQFCDPLPEQYLDFKEMVHFIFPKIVDTKFMCSMEPLREVISSSILEHMLQATDSEPFERPEIKMDEKYGYNLDCGKYHEAGYDAYVTGVCFLSLQKYLQSKKKSASDLSGIEPYVNKLFLMRTPDTYIDLEKADPVPCRDHVFHVTFPKTWTSQNLIQLFSAFGSVQIQWLNDTSAWVALFEKKEARNAVKSLCKGKLPKGVVVKTYESMTQFDSPRPNKRKPETSSASGNSSKATSIPEYLKRRKTSKNGYVSSQVDPVPKETKDASNPEKCISDLEKGANSTGGNSAMFAVDSEWG